VVVDMENILFSIKIMNGYKKHFIFTREAQHINGVVPDRC
jgi:hypothetical protein